MYDAAADEMNTSFPEFMINAFNTSPENGAIIQAGREVCALKGMFIKKKRYALLCYDIERSDTPKIIQEFLEEVLIKVLSGSDEDEIMDKVKEFRHEFRSWPGWIKGTPKRVNGLTKKIELEEKLGKIAMAGHQRAAKNWNR